MTTKIKCSHKDCEQEGLYRTGTLKNARVWCGKHYVEYLRKRANQKGSVVWGGLE